MAFTKIVLIEMNIWEGKLMPQEYLLIFEMNIWFIWVVRADPWSKPLRWSLGYLEKWEEKKKNSKIYDIWSDL